MVSFTDIVRVDIDLSSSPAEGFSYSVPLNSKPKAICARNAIRIGKYSFAEYVGRRLFKDGIGFVPLKGSNASAHMYENSHISTKIPCTAEDFLVYCHELGHQKSKQPPRANRGFASVFTCENTIICEFNAWKWGIRYFKRLGFVMDDACKKVVKESFESYTSSFANDFVKGKFEKELSQIAGIEINCKRSITDNHISFNTSTFKYDTIKVWFDDFMVYETPKKLPVVKEKPKHWKPWHDMKDKQIKKTWRNMR